MQYYQIKSQGLQGVDVSKEITLKEYGFGYHTLPRKGIYRFYVGEGIDSEGFNWFELLELPLNVKIEDEYNWINVKDVCAYCGLSAEEWLKLDAPAKLYDVICHYGYSNV